MVVFVPSPDELPMYALAFVAPGATPVEVRLLNVVLGGCAAFVALAVFTPLLHFFAVLFQIAIHPSDGAFMNALVVTKFLWTGISAARAVNEIAASRTDRKYFMISDD